MVNTYRRKTLIGTSVLLLVASWPVNPNSDDVAVAYEVTSKTIDLYQLLKSESFVTGTVEAIPGREISVNMRTIMPQSSSKNEARNKMTSPQNLDDNVLLVVNDPNQVIEYYQDGKTRRHLLVIGTILRSFSSEYQSAVVQDGAGFIRSTSIDPNVGPKTAGLSAEKTPSAPD